MSDNMRDFFGDLGKRIGETAETMTSKAGDAIEIQRLKGQIRDLSRGNAVDLMELGRKIYDRYKAGEAVDESEKAFCEAIQNREETIAAYEKKISRIKGASECPGCGKMVAKDMAYCPYCGEKVVWEEEAEETEETEPYADAVKEKVEKAADKAGEMACKAVDKAEEMADKTADKFGAAAEKASDKFGAAADKAAEKISGAAEKAADKINGR